jgi:hypothetical protein
MAASSAVHLAERGYTVEFVTPTVRVDDAPVADGPVGDVLGELALVTLGTRPADLEERSGSGAPPIVAIAGDVDEQTLRWMLAQRSPRAPAVVLLAGPATPADPTSLGARQLDGERPDPDPVRTAFERAGWTVARVSITRSPDDAWLALLGGEPDAVLDWAVPSAVRGG